MINQKQIVVPKVRTVDVTDFDATANFITEPVEFPNSHKDWSIDFQVADTLGVPADSFAVDATGANITDGAYPGVEIEGGAIVNLTVAGGVVTVVAFVSGGTGYINGNSYGLVVPLPGTAPTQPTFTATVTTNTDSTATVLVCNTLDGVYKEYKTASTSVPLATVTGIFDDIMPYRYMTISYTANTSTGQIGISICR